MKQNNRVEYGSAKEKIQEAAIELFSKKGYARTTTSAIAKRAKVNEFSLFRIFGNKKALLYDVYFQMTPMAANVDLTGLTAGANLEKDLTILLRTYLVLHLQHMPAYRLSLQLQEEIYDRDLYYASFANIQGLIAQFVDYLETLKREGKIAKVDAAAFCEYMFSLFLINAIGFTTREFGETPDDIDKTVASFAKAYAKDFAKALAPRTDLE